jgi:hypothetical protein
MHKTIIDFESKKADPQQLFAIDGGATFLLRFSPMPALGLSFCWV